MKERTPEIQTSQTGYDRDVGLDDLLKGFQAHGVEVSDLPDGWKGLKKGDVIDNLLPDSIVYRGKAHRPARKFGVPIALLN